MDTTDLNASPGPICCATCAEWLHLHLEGEAEPLLSRTLKEHLAACPACARRYEALERERVEVLEALLSTPPLSPRFASQVMGRIRGLERSERNRRLRRRLYRLLSGTAVAAAAAAAALLIVLRTGGGQPREAQTNVVIGSKPVPTPSFIRYAVPPGAGIVPRCPDEKVEPLPLPPTSGDQVGVNESIDVTAALLRLEDRLPCSRDVNHDGEMDVSDAAHLFMLAVAPPPADMVLAIDSGETDCTLTCSRSTGL